MGRAKTARFDSAPLDTAGPSLRLEALSSRGFKDTRLLGFPPTFLLLVPFSWASQHWSQPLFFVCVHTHTPGSHSGSWL